MKNLTALNELLERIGMSATISYNSDEIIVGARVWVKLDDQWLNTWMKSVDDLEAYNAKQIKELREILAMFIEQQEKTT
jgi:hypothetical protein